MYSRYQNSLKLGDKLDLGIGKKLGWGWGGISLNVCSV
jgi:hypothetical protein